MSWAAFLQRFLLVFGGTLVSAFALIVLMNPFGNLPLRAFGADTGATSSPPPMTKALPSS